MNRTKWLLLAILFVPAVAILALAAKNDVQAIEIPLISGSKSTVSSVNVQALEDAGFTGVSELAESGKQFWQPVKYFKVNETATWTTADGKRESTNIVAISAIDLSDPSFSYNNGAIESKTFDNVSQARFTKPGQMASPGKYIVVTGPDRSKVEKLALYLQQNYR